MRIGILGGTGPAGSSLGLRLASVGYDVVLGSRSKYRAMETRDKLLVRWPGREMSLECGDNHTAAEADMVVVATPWDAAAETAWTVSDQLVDKNVICMCNALAKVHTEFMPLVPPRGSVAASVQAELPRSRVAAAMHHVPAKELGHLDDPVDTDVLICSDFPEATAAVIDLVSNIPGLRPLDAGALSNAAPIEAFAAVLLQLNMRYPGRAAIRFTGLDLDSA